MLHLRYMNSIVNSMQIPASTFKRAISWNLSPLGGRDEKTQPCALVRLSSSSHDWIEISVSFDGSMCSGTKWSLRALPFAEHVRRRMKWGIEQWKMDSLRWTAGKLRWTAYSLSFATFGTAQVSVLFGSSGIAIWNEIGIKIIKLKFNWNVISQIFVGLWA